MRYYTVLWRTGGPRSEARPCGEMASGLEHLRVDLDGKRQRGNRAHAGNRVAKRTDVPEDVSRTGDQTLADLAGFVRGVQFGVDVFDADVDFVDLLAQKGWCCTDPIWVWWLRPGGVGSPPSLSEDAPCRSNITPNIAIISRSAGTGSQTGRNMTSPCGSAVA